MQIKFAGQLIGQDKIDGGTDAISELMTDRDANGQWCDYLRSPDAVPRARLNRKRTISYKIVPAPFATPGAACQALLLYLDTLPDSGVLVVTSDNIGTTYGNAVLKTPKAIEKNGATIAVQVTFWVGPGSNTGSGVITDQSAAPITDQSGNPLTS